MSNQDGMHLVHGMGDGDDCMPADTAYCVRVINVGNGGEVVPDGYYFVQWTPATDMSSTCGSVDLSREYSGIGFGWSEPWCREAMVVESTAGSQARWEQAHDGAHTHNHLQFHYGVTQRVPKVDGTLQGAISVKTEARFHCWYYFGECKWGTQTWDLDSANLEQEAAWANIALPNLPLVGQDYSYAEALGLVDQGNADPAVTLAKTLIGAKLLLASGIPASASALDAIGDADLALSGQGEKLPWQSHVISPAEAEHLTSVRQALVDAYVTQRGG